MKPDATGDTHETRSRIMRSVGSRDTDLEMLLRRRLWREGLRYRLNIKVQGTRPDIIFPRAKLAVFVDGCFWHGCPTHYALPKSNQGFWRAKVEANVQRDIRHNQVLKESGWLAFRCWGCEVKQDRRAVVSRIKTLVRERSR